MIQLTAEVRPDVDVIFKTEVDLGQVRTWSYSALKVFEECPYRTYISRVKKITEPTNPAAKRGSNIHQQAEDYVKGTLEEFPDTLKKFKKEFETLRKLFAEAKVELEGEWGFSIAVSYTHLTLPTKA